MMNQPKTIANPATMPSIVITEATRLDFLPLDAISTIPLVARDRLRMQGWRLWGTLRLPIMPMQGHEAMIRSKRIMAVRDVY